MAAVAEALLLPLLLLGEKGVPNREAAEEEAEAAAKGLFMWMLLLTPVLLPLAEEEAEAVVWLLPAVVVGATKKW